ncbi:hypothetical protein [Nocardioides sp.]|uniref:hypothetical protein n=1 Tax=Nocardioides sp. TaxID=35761 RepID=UPI003518AE38
MARIPTTHHVAEAHVIDCPVCGVAITAEVHATSITTIAVAKRDGTATANVEVDVTRFHVNHRCQGRALPDESNEDGAA